MTGALDSFLCTRRARKDYYSQLTEAERDEREEFVVDACYLMRDRFRGEEVFETLGLDVKACAEWVDTSPLMIQFRSHLFSRIVPIVKDIGLWGDKVQKAIGTWVSTTWPASTSRR